MPRPRTIFLDIDKISKLYHQDGLTSRQIAKKFGVSKRLILSRMKEARIPVRPRGQRFEDGETRVCYDCKNRLPLTDFYRNKSQKLGRKYQCKECRKNYRRRKKYNLSKEEFDALLKIGSCEICGSTISLVIDHCHDTNKVRGLLCNGCNSGLGFFRDDQTRLHAALSYLKKHTQT